jgi:hypothetical protein
MISRVQYLPFVKQENFLCSKALGRLLRVHNPNLEMVPVHYGGRYLISDGEASKRHLCTVHILVSKSRPKVQGAHLGKQISVTPSVVLRTRW